MAAAAFPERHELKQFTGESCGHAEAEYPHLRAEMNADPFRRGRDQVRTDRSSTVAMPPSPRAPDVGKHLPIAPTAPCSQQCLLGPVEPQPGRGPVSARHIDPAGRCGWVGAWLRSKEGLKKACNRKPDCIDGLFDDDFGARLMQQAALLRAYARRLVGSQAADADDLVQDTLLRCWAARRSFRPGTNLGAWSRTVMRNSFLSGRRRARFHADLPDDALERLLSVPESQDNAVNLHDVACALGDLIPEQREAILLAAEGLSIEEAAAELSIPEGTFKSRVWRGRLRLKQLTEGTEIAPIEGAATRSPDRRMVQKARKSRVRRDWKNVMIG